MTWSGYNTEDTNAVFKVNNYADNAGKIKGVGCDGTTSGIDATLPTYSSPFVGGGYSFTDTPIEVAGPGAPYSVISSYNNTDGSRPAFPKEFRSALTGGKKRRTQYGCSRKKSGGRRNTKKRRSTKRRSTKKRRTVKRRSTKKRRTVKRMHTVKRMRGGMSSASDYTEGRDSSQDIPYGNNAHSFGQGLNVKLSANESGMASPPPMMPYNDCGKYTRN
jgi:hypothetical protein